MSQLSTYILQCYVKVRNGNTRIKSKMSIYCYGAVWLVTYTDWFVICFIPKKMKQWKIGYHTWASVSTQNCMITDCNLSRSGCWTGIWKLYDDTNCADTIEIKRQADIFSVSLCSEVPSGLLCKYFFWRMRLIFDVTTLCFWCNSVGYTAYDDEQR